MAGACPSQTEPQVPTYHVLPCVFLCSPQLTSQCLDFLLLGKHISTLPGVASYLDVAEVLGAGYLIPSLSHAYHGIVCGYIFKRMAALSW